ncbi:MAG TPA: apolipoprotein N-acyltransferase [Candidatus Binataceae bacterium]|nr:apolipoprotein N-acyltransferase [Candidatus Binataceae bacterium]
MTQSSLLNRIALCVASGLALGMAFPKFDFAILAWVAFVPLFHAIEGEPLGRVFRWAFLAGFASYVISMYWIVVPLTDFAGVRIELAFLPMLLLAAVMALFSGLAIWIGAAVSRRMRISIAITMPIAWTAVEWLRTYFPIGFPWNLLGYTAYRHLELIQFAEFTGVYGVSALIVFFNTVVYLVVLRRGAAREQALGLSVLTGAMIAVLGFGAWRLADLRTEKPTGTIRAAMVQADIPESLKWDPSFLPKSFKIYQDQSIAIAKRGADLIVWPEAAAAFLFQPDDHYPAEFASDAAYRNALLALARSIDVPILFGAPALGEQRGDLGFYNRAYLVSATGQVIAHYDKMQLVPFGEYVPFHAVLGFIVNRVVPGFGDMFAGTERTLFPLGGAKLGVLICYESVFPDLTRREVKAGADVLVNITNDGWYVRSSAPYQSLAMAAMRSAETKAPMIRAANTGITAIIKPSGEITESTPIFARGSEIGVVRWRPVRTFYTIAGDVFAELCFLLTTLALLAAWRFPRKLKPLEALAEQLAARNGHSRASH